VAASDKKADRIKQLFDAINGAHRIDWETVNQRGHDFSLDNQLTEEEFKTLEDQGMPTFTINRIIPVVEMLNFYATAQSPRWQAVGVEGSDTDVAAVFADIADYIWNLSDGSSLYANAVNDAITKSVGYLMVTVDSNLDRGMGEVIIQQPDPFDVWVDPKSRDPLFRDATHIIIRKLLPRSHLLNIYPEYSRKIKSASSRYQTEYNYTEGSDISNDFQYKDINYAYNAEGETEEFLEFYECYEREKKAYYNVFYQIPPSPQELKKISQGVQVQLKEMKKEMDVQLKELDAKLSEGVQKGDVLPERRKLELEKAVKMNEQQLASAEQQLLAEAQKQASIVQNKVVSEKEYKLLSEDRTFSKTVVDAIKFYKQGIKLTCVAGDKMIYQKNLPLTMYPIIPIIYKWTGTPYPMSAVSPLIGKQRELNKAHQLMIHNASLGSSLRWMYYEGSIDTDHWEQHATAPGGLLPVNQGYDFPKEVLPMPITNAFADIATLGKGDMEYLAGIYSSMQGDTGAQHDTYRGMLAIDEYGTRRIKQWLKNSIEPALKQMGEVIKEYSQAVYRAHKVFRIVQSSALQEDRQTEINVPIYNDLGKAIGKWNDYGAAKFDVRIVAGSTLPVNRWAYLAELKELMKLGIVDDIAVLAETDIRNKEQISKRKSLYAQLKGALAELQEKMKDKEGTIETLERQLVQAGIRDKVRTVETELRKGATNAQGRMALAASKMEQDAVVVKEKAGVELSAFKKDIQLAKRSNNEKKSS